jgi:hypothetical protein
MPSPTNPFDMMLYVPQFSSQLELLSLVYVIQSNGRVAPAHSQVVSENAQ